MIRRVIALRWWIIGLVTIGTILNYLTRAILGVAAPTLQEDLGITAQEYSWITAAFQIGIMLQPVSGYVLDVIGLKFGFALFAAVWSGITMAHGLAGSWLAFAGLRGLMGLAEGSAQPGGMKAVSEWFPAKERGLAGGVYNIGASLGSVIAPPLVAISIYLYDWRMAFVVAGAMGFVWVGFWLRYYYSPDKHPRLSAEERAVIEAGQEKHLSADPQQRPSIRTLVRQRNLWGIALPRMLADPTWGTLAYWVPLYMMTERGLNLKEFALFGWLPFIAADIGCLAGPAIVLWLQKRGIDLINARRWAFTVGALLMTSMMFVGQVVHPYAAIALLCVGGFAHQTLSITVITMASDLFKKSEVATVAGFAGMCGNFGVLVFSLLIGGLVATVGYNPFFVALAVFDLIGAVVLWTFVRAPRAPQPAAA